MSQVKELTRRVGKLLDQAARAERLRSDEAEQAWSIFSAQMRELPREGILDALDRATGRSKRRHRAAVYLLAELGDVPGAVERIGQLLAQGNIDPREREWLLQTIGLNRWVRLAPVLNDLMLNDSDVSCRREAIRVAGVLRQEVNFPVILQLAKEGHPGLAWTLKDYGREEGRTYLNEVFHLPFDPSPQWLQARDFGYTDVERVRERTAWTARKCERLIAAWGLAKLGDRTAILYLGEMLYDPDYCGRDHSFLGESLRAAQAVADVFGLPFEWNKDCVGTIQQWWEANKQRVLGPTKMRPGESPSREP